MQIDIRAIDSPLPSKLRAHLLQRLRFALWRFRDRVARISVRLSDLNGPRGGQDKMCRLRIKLRGPGEVLIEDREADLRTAIDRAADRAGRSLGRRLHRIRGFGASECRRMHT